MKKQLSPAMTDDGENYILAVHPWTFACIVGGYELEDVEDTVLEAGGIIDQVHAGVMGIGLKQ